MSPLTITYGLLFYVAAAVFVVGLARKLRCYAKTPAPLKIPTTPAPLTAAGVGWRVAREVVFFESLFKSSKWTWILGWTLHAALLLAFFRHLRYVQQPVWSAVALLQPVGTYAGFALVAALAGLWARRFLVDRVRYISTPSDHLMLALLLAIACSGLAMRFVAHTDVVALKVFVLGLLRLDLQPLPSDPALLAHLALAALLMVIFPISKLLHAPGLFFSPTRNQADTARESRHVSSWATALEQRHNP